MSAILRGPRRGHHGGGSSHGHGGNQTNGTLNQPTQADDWRDYRRRKQYPDSTSLADSIGNVTQTNQTSGNTTVSAGAAAGTAGSANAHTKTDGVAGLNVADSPSKTNRSEDAGTNSTNNTGNGSTNNNTNGGGNTTNDN